MKASEQALVPDFFRQAIADATPDPKKPKTTDDDLLLSLAESESWELLKGIIENIMHGIDQGTKQAVGAAKTWEEAGKSYFARDVSVDMAQSIIDIVELRKQAKYAEQSAEPKGE